MPEKKSVKQVFEEILVSDPTSILDLIDRVHVKARDLSTDTEKMKLYYQTLEYIYKIQNDQQ